MEQKRIQITQLFQEVRHILKTTLSREFGDIELTAPQGMVIMTLVRKGSLKISDISRELSLSDSTVSGIIDRLENQGVVTRQRSDEDKRVVFVQITEDFKEKHKKLHHHFGEYFGNLLSEASKEEIDKISEGLTILKRLLEKNHSTGEKTTHAETV